MCPGGVCDRNVPVNMQPTTSAHDAAPADASNSTDVQMQMLRQMQQMQQLQMQVVQQMQQQQQDHAQRTDELIQAQQVRSDELMQRMLDIMQSHDRQRDRVENVGIGESATMGGSSQPTPQQQQTSILRPRPNTLLLRGGPNEPKWAHWVE